MPPATHLQRSATAMLDDAMGRGNGWSFLESLFQPAAVNQPFRPADEVLMEFGRLQRSAVGQQLLEWLHRISDLSPYPAVTLRGFEQAALAAAKHEGRSGVGLAIRAAEREGKAMFEHKTSQGANP